MRPVWTVLVLPVLVCAGAFYLLSSQLYPRHNTKQHKDDDDNAAKAATLASTASSDIGDDRVVLYPRLLFPMPQRFEELLHGGGSDGGSRRRRRGSNDDPKTGNNQFTTSESSLPSPEYVLFALPMPQLHRDLVVNLSLFRDVLAPDFIVQHLDQNHSWLGEDHISSSSSSGYFEAKSQDYFTTGSVSFEHGHPYAEAEHGAGMDRHASISNCIYSGSVVGVPDSHTVLSLCHGLLGSIQTSDGSYFIEPLSSSSSSHLGSTKSSSSSDGSPVFEYQSPHVLYKPKSSQTFQNDYKRRPPRRRRNDESDGNVIRFQRRNGSSPWTRSPVDPREPHAFHGRRPKRESVGIWSYHHYVEILVVADFKMKRYHGPNLENYVLTLLSIVASIYRHPSLEASVNIALVRLVELESETSGPFITENAQETLRHFCRWQHGLNDPDDNSMNHHDAAILITRQDICRAPGKCDTLGLAELGTMCDPFRSCAIIEDNGLSAAFTIAHELGHIFNIPHDDEKKCSAFMTLEKINYHIMAPTLEFNTHPWSWSICSAKMLRKFLDSHRNVYCLRNQPSQRKYYNRFTAQKAPGLTFDAHQQCQFVYGGGASLCPYMPACKRLWCQTSYGYQGGCRTQHMPWADGTPCHNEKWCHKGECVGLAPDHMSAISGEWGEWGEWSECSRTCGGGVKQSSRECNSPRPANGGNYCEGLRVRYRSCNMKDCPEDAVNFREYQCSEYNGKTFNIHGVPPDVEWVPKHNGVNEAERCKLWCQVKNSAAFYMLKDKVIDGTSCGRYTDDICVNGECKSAGCDHRLGSTTARDQCGVCGGDGTKCQQIKGSYNERRGYGYNMVLKIPAGATNIDIRQHGWNDRKDDDNYLALQNSRAEFILNGAFQVSVFQQEILVRGTILFYSGSDTPVERINSSRPTSEDLYLHVLSVGGLYPPDLRYEYVVSDDPYANRFQPDFAWRPLDDWTTCSSACQGTQVQKIICVDMSSDGEVDEAYCRSIAKPRDMTKACNSHCYLRWHSEPVGECSATCGTGEQTHSYRCVMVSGDQQQTVDDRFCSEIDRPASTIPCFRDCTGRRWTYSRWTSCSVTCGGGTQTRDAFCADEHSDTLDIRYCAGLPQETLRMDCAQVPCPAWHYDEWSECSHTCDGGVKYRRASCRDAELREIDERFCDDGLKQDRQSCNTQICASWTYGQWSECSKTCGDGVANRSSFCVNSRNERIADEYCDVRTRINSKSCNAQSCPRWKVGDWSPCSRSCLDGWMSRTVFCVDGSGLEISRSYCSEPAPNSHEMCDMGSCPFWRTGDWSQCSITCGNGTKSRRVECSYKDQIVDEAYCHEQGKPDVHADCREIQCPVWEVGPWETCSASCGEGTQSRDIFCQVPGTGGQQTDFSRCKGTTRPTTIRACNTGPCPNSNDLPAVAVRVFTTSISGSSTTTTTSPANVANLRYDTGLWSSCSATCGNGTQARTVACRDVFGRTLPDVFCGNLRKPDSTRPCQQKPCGQWIVGPWLECSTTCGTSLRTWRLVQCIAPPHGATDTCNAASMPESERFCEVPVCPVSDNSAFIDNSIHTILNNNNKGTLDQGAESTPPETGWIVGHWSSCSTTCGWGHQRRLVGCIPSSNPIRSSCDANLRPSSIKICRIDTCPLWFKGPWQQCSRTCDGGSQHRSVECRLTETSELRPESQCSAPKPFDQQRCNTQSCRRGVAWKTGKWSACSVTCGKGVSHRDITCVDENEANLALNETECIGLTKPVTQHTCRMKRCPRWKKLPWSQCSATCGRGTKVRKVECRLDRHTLLYDSKCKHPKPETALKCRGPPCPTYRWHASKWTPCSEKCGNGTQFREILCKNQFGQRAPPRECDSSQKPLAVRSCTRLDCPFEWLPGPWSSCSQSCDRGVQRRTLECRVRSTDVDVLASEASQENCAAIPRPSEARNCTLGSCESLHFWQMTPWSPCSATCGIGVQQRDVVCKDKQGNRVRKHKCTISLRPPSRRRCLIRNCEPGDCSELKSFQNVSIDGVYKLLVHGQRLLVYCSHLNQSIPKEYLPLTAGPMQNYAEVYGKRLSYPFTCPHGGLRNNSCDCTDAPAAKMGMTRFSMVRIDLVNMKIDGSDFTFASNEFGSPIAFGTAGDCYSAVDCPQGRFSIDLRGTGFKLATETRWTEVGHRVSMDVSLAKDRKSVTGKCGGYCGSCSPDLHIGIKVQLEAVR